MRKPSNRRPYKKRRTNKKLKPTVSKSVKKYVKKAIHNQIENKLVIQYASNQTLTGSGFIIPLVPLISQGTGASSRVGNVVTLLSANIDIIVNTVPYNSTTNPYGGPVHFRWFLISQRNTNGSVFSLTNFFQINNSSVTLQGNQLDQLLSINNDDYNCHRQGKFRLGCSSSSTAFPVATGVYEASKVSINKRLYFNKYMNKKIKFDDTVVTPQNTNLWLVIIPSYANGSSVSGYTPANISYVLSHTYEDA